jgi:hypothetical protein
MARACEFVQLFVSIYLIIGSFHFVSCFSRCATPPDAYIYILCFARFIIYFDIRFWPCSLFSALPVSELYRQLCLCYISCCVSINKPGAAIFSLLYFIKKGNLI